MFTWCTESEWCDEAFDLDYIANERGLFCSKDEAVADSKRHGYEGVIILEV